MVHTVGVHGGALSALPSAATGQGYTGAWIAAFGVPLFRVRRLWWLSAVTATVRRLPVADASPTCGGRVGGPHPSRTDPHRCSRCCRDSRRACHDGFHAARRRVRSHPEAGAAAVWHASRRRHRRREAGRRRSELLATTTWGHGGGGRGCCHPSFGWSLWGWGASGWGGASGCAGCLVSCARAKRALRAKGTLRAKRALRARGTLRVLRSARLPQPALRACPTTPAPRPTHDQQPQPRAPRVTKNLNPRPAPNQ